MEDITIASATPEMAEVCSELAILAAPELLPAVFGQDVQQFWNKAFRHRRCCFSYKHSICLQVNAETVGLAIMYSNVDKKKEGLRSLLIMLRYLKWTFFRKLSALKQAGEIMAQIQENDHYLSNLAILPRHRSLGYGAKLMESIEESAKKAGSRRMVLDAETHKDKTVQFYQRLGYDIEARTPMLRTRDGDFECYRMFKYL